jgi:hypothetical protein
MPDELRATASPRTCERRLYPRQQVLFSVVELGIDNGGIVVNVSERGLAIQSVRSLPEDPLQQMRLQFSQPDAWLEIRGRIAWISASRKAAGFEFVGLSQEGRTRITRWISSLAQSNATEGERTSVETELAACRSTQAEAERSIIVPDSKITGPSVGHVGQVLAVETASRSVAGNGGSRVGSPFLSYGAKQSRRDHAVHSGSSGRRLGVLLVAILLSSLLAFLIFHWRSIAGHRPVKQPVLAAMDAPLRSSVPAPPARPSVQQGPRLASPVFLQVGAMTQKDNADRLTDSLRKKGFPAFVSHYEADRFYRVIMGPYDGLGAASRIKDELKKQNLDAIIRRVNEATFTGGKSRRN